MKKPIPLILLALLCLALLIAFLNREEMPSAEPGNQEDHATSSHVTKSLEGTSGTVTESGHAGSGLKKAITLEPLTPIADDIFTAEADAVIKPGETLVMGGYKTENGTHEISFLKPTRVTLEDGRELIEIQPRTLTISDEFALQSGLDSLTTPAPIADQNAEAWKAQDVRSTFQSASQAAGTGMMNGPSISIAPGEPFAMSVGGENGSAKYSITGTVTVNADGNFAITSRTERTPGGQH